MAKLSCFLFISLDGYYKGPEDDISWHKHGQEEGQFSADSLGAENTLVFGRITYEMMAGFWTLPMAFENMPEVAAGMNKAQKIVFSKTLDKADWQNTRLIKTDMIAAMKKLKEESANDMTILGSGNIVTQFAEAGLIDGYQIMIDPVAIGSGTPIFQGLTKKLDLQLTSTRSFKSGVVLHSYTPGF